MPIRRTHLIMAGLLIGLLLIRATRVLESCTQSNSLKQTRQTSCRHTHRFSTPQSSMHLGTSGGCLLQSLHRPHLSIGTCNTKKSPPTMLITSGLSPCSSSSPDAATNLQNPGSRTWLIPTTSDHPARTGTPIPLAASSRMVTVSPSSRSTTLPIRSNGVYHRRLQHPSASTAASGSKPRRSSGRHLSLASPGCLTIASRTAPSA